MMALSRKAATVYGNGAVLSLSHDADGRETLRVGFSAGAGGEVLRHETQHSPSGQKVQRVESSLGSAVATLLWGYDADYQLVNEERIGEAGFVTTYVYDATGNRLTQEHDGVFTTYAYDAANQLLHSESSDGLTTYTYDGNGNRTSQTDSSGLQEFGWDGENRLSHLQVLAGVTTFGYSGDGLRQVKEDDSGTTIYVPDEQNVLQVLAPDAASSGEYTNAPGEWGTLVSQRSNGASDFYFADDQANTRQS